MALFRTRLLPSNLKFRLTAVVIVLVLAATMLVTSLALTLVERDMKSVIGDQQFALLSVAAGFIDERVGAKRQLIADIARAAPVAALPERQVLQMFLAHYPGVTREFSNLTAFAPSGKILASVVQPAPDALIDGRCDAFFAQAVARKQGTVSAPFVSPLSGAQIIAFSAPVLDASGKVLYVLAGSVELEHAGFLRQLDRVRPGKSGFAYLMTSEGVLIDHPDRSRLLQHINMRPGTNQATERALAGFEGWTEAANKDRSDGIYSYKRLASTDWIVGARFPTDEAFGPIARMHRHAMLAATGVAALAGLLAWLVIYRLLSPLESLRRNVAAIRGQRAGIEVLQLSRPDEIGELGAAFHALMAERETALEHTRDSERRARIIADNIPALIAYFDSEQRYRFANAHYETVFGIDVLGMLGKTVREVIGEDNYRATMPRLMAALAGEHMHFELEVQTLSRPMYSMVDYIPDVGADGRVLGVYVLVLDISARKHIELAQAANEKRLRLITDNLPVLISYIDRDFKYRFGNAMFEKWFGVAPGSLPGRSIVEVMGDEAYALVLPHLETAFQGAPVTFEREAVINGVGRTLEGTFVPDVQPDGSVAGVYVLTTDMTRIKEVEGRLMQLARADSLTGIANRRMFNETLQVALGRARRHGNFLALAYLDIDHFKRINDSYGHGVGDEVLKEFARRLVASVRATDAVARLSGDEFVIILEDLHNDREVSMVAAKIIDAVHAPFIIGEHALQVTTSIGIAHFSAGDESHEGLLLNADSALYAAKHRGRDCFSVFGREPERGQLDD
jgi:diguanylate cyclase (GGDEF)-like protein/PAS domain S-box-containing protein